MKGIVLAGGFGSRLYPMTTIVSKQLLPVYNKPMVFYPIAILMQSKIKDILIISDKQNIDGFRKLLGTGTNLGVNFSYLTQDEPNGIAEALKIGGEFIGQDDFVLILGDNVFYGADIDYVLSIAKNNLNSGYSTIFANNVKDPERFGVVEIDELDNPISIAEKPLKPKSNYAVTGLYFYKNDVVKIFDKLVPSSRNEYEISDVNQLLLNDKKLKVIKLERGFAWFDTGTPDALLEASSFIRIIENNQSIMIACLEEISFYNNWINKDDLFALISNNLNSEYNKYLKNLIIKRRENYNESH